MDDNNSAVMIIDVINVDSVKDQMDKIAQFQKLVHANMTAGQDYGIIPGTDKKSLLKPGAEKICMLMGLVSTYEFLASTRDYDKGFFEYQIKCRLIKNGLVITEGLGAANTLEKKYIKQDPYSIDNTVMKMAKKRALVDATLMVGSLSNIFTQDMDDDDEQLKLKQKQDTRPATDQDGAISTAQAKRMFAIAKGNADLVKEVMGKHGYENSKDVLKLDYEKVCKELECRVMELEECQTQ